MAQLSEENMTLREENVGVSAENERLVRTQEAGDALQNAQHRTEALLEGEKAELETSIRQARERMAIFLSAEERMQTSVEEIKVDKESIERQLISVLVERISCFCGSRCTWPRMNWNLTQQ